MEREKAIGILEHMRKCNTVRKYEDEALDIAISDLKCIEQYKWERDIAIEQLNEIGLSLGQKVDHVKEAIDKQTAVSRVIIEGQYFCPKCKNLMKYPGYCGCGQKVY